jgi:NADH dehydrogenase
VILVTGATGFIGRHVVRTLVEGGARVRGMVRDLRGATALEGIECELVRGDVTDPDSLRAAAAGCEAVVHLVAVISGRPREFEQVIGEGTRNVVAAAQQAGARRIAYVSALGAHGPQAPDVPYYRAKRHAEEAVAGSGLEHVILRPTFVFGADGGALPRFLRIARLAPVTPIVGSGDQRVQPVWVDDAARALTLALETRESGIVVELGGPDVVDWNELWRRIKTALGAHRPALHVPVWLMRTQAVFLERLPDPPVTRDQLTMLGGPDNVVADGGASMTRLGLGDRVPLDEQLARAVAER